MNKVFVIGLPKTGTTSLSKALEILGYSSIHYPKSFEEIAAYDSASDSFVAINYPELDKRYPDSKFILLEREVNGWLRSLAKHIQRLDTPKPGSVSYDLRVQAIGAAEYNEQLARQKYEAHRHDVRDYFSEREADLLIINLNDDNLWRKLCLFLDKEIPDCDFPYLNIASADSISHAEVADTDKGSFIKRIWRKFF